MPVIVEWDDPPQNSIIRMTLYGAWGWEDVRGAVKEANQRLDSADAPVDFIIHLQDSALVPPNFKANVGGFVRDIHPKAGLVVMVLPKILNEILPIFSALNGGMGFEYRFAPSVETARQILKSRGTPE
ncbi:MAG: hypothetical protein DWB42_09945 [Chloroflexi bacterium]|nr:hypothetical protein [Chloroflexota bacterium]MDL1885161.1 hypothetical protein [Anaerolineae bacterium CFX8]